MEQVRWGIIGLGNIALKFAESFQYTKNAKHKFNIVYESKIFLFAPTI